MKTESLFLKRCFWMLFSILGIMLGVSCSDSDDEMGDEGDGGTTATTPFKSVQVEADGEKVQGPRSPVEAAPHRLVQGECARIS